MANHRHRPTSLQRRLHALRNTPPHRRTKNSSSTTSTRSDETKSPPRQALASLHPNLRRLPSRTNMARETSSDTKVGQKRKRVAGGANENSHSAGRTLRGVSRFKRRRSHQPDSDMEVDQEELHWVEMDSDEEDGEAEYHADEEPTDEFLIQEAVEWKLHRLRKDDLIRLHNLAGLHSDDADSLTKNELVEQIIAAREKTRPTTRQTTRRRRASHADEPPSSSSSGRSQENDGGDEHTEPSKKATLKRRATEDQQSVGVGRSKQALKGRSFSLGNFFQARETRRTRFANGIRSPQTRRASATAHSSCRSSPSEVVTPIPPFSPPKTRSGTTRVAKDKKKHVEFNDEVDVDEATEQEENDADEGDDEEDEAETPSTEPSPRRLRSSGAAKVRRVTPARRAKRRIGSLRESDDEDEEEEEEEEAEEEEEEEVDELDEDDVVDDGEVVESVPASSDVSDEEDGNENQEEDEVDELMSSASPSPAPKTPSPPPRNLRKRQTKAQSNAPARRLRPRRGKADPEEEEGKDVSEEAEEDIELDEVEEEEEEENEPDDEVEQEEEDELNEESTEDTDDSMEDVIDLSAATAKTLVRLRRDDLVRLCETRDLDAEGTKPQLVQALLVWRDRHSSGNTSPSSGASTARPPSTSKTTVKDDVPTTPVLLRSQRVHVTPPLSNATVDPKDAEPELELDLESLGLEDREIPADKIHKGERIGSGGFKDVFKGKFRNRNIAIAEFRGQLSPMDIKELKLLRDFDHPNVVRFIGVSIPEDTRSTPAMIVNELCSNGDLFDYTRNVPPPSLHKLLQMMLDVARGIEYLHLRKPSVIHRDIKSSNILITSKGICKIADFGLAKVKQSTRSMVRSLVGTVNWQAPELWHPHPKYDHKVDVFSCGVVFWEMLQWHVPKDQKKYPWEGMNEHAIYEAVGTKKQRPPLTGLRKRWCKEVVDLVERMWKQEPSDRPTISEVVEELEELVTQYR